MGLITFMNGAGAQEAIIRLARQMRARGHEMEVWCFYERAPAFPGEPGLDIFFRKPRLGPAEYLVAFGRLLRGLRERRPDAIVCFLPLAAIFGSIAGKLAGVRARIASQRSPGTTYGRIMRTLDRWCGATSLYTANVCVSEAVRQSFSDYPPAYRAKLSVIHNGIEWPGMLPDRATARASLGIKPDAPTLVALGRMNYQKNYEFLLDRLAEVQGLDLVVAGDGEDRPALEAQVRRLGLSDRVRFLGLVDRRRVRELLAAADAFVQTSRFEGQSNAVLEAMHASLPIVVADIPEQRETLVDHDGSEAGILIPFESHADWRAAFERLRDDEGYRRRLGAEAKGAVERRFGLAAMVDRFEAKIHQSAHS